jgi:hypothetical protein
MSADGNNYGLNGNYDYNEFEIDSFDALQAYNGSYTISNWPKIFFGKPLENVAAVKILETTIPFTYYAVNSSNNTFLLNASTITIPVGTYTSAEMVTTLGSLLSAALAGTTVSYSDTTMKFTISNTVPTAFTLTFGSAGNDGQTNARLILGFNAGVTSSSATQVAPNVAQLNGPPYLYLNSRSLGSMVHLYLNSDGIVNATGKGADGPQVCMIPVNTTRGNTITYKDPDPQKWFYTGSQNFTGFLDFYLTLGVSPENIPLDLNGGRFVVKLGILQTRAQGNDNMTSTRGNHRVVSRTWQAGGNRMEF